MSPAKKVLIFVVAIYVLFVFSGFLLPKQTTLSRSVIVEADQGAVFDLVGDHKKFNTWSPWAAYDPKMHVEYEGPSTGVGAKQIWQSTHPKVGNGESTYTRYEPNASVSMTLDFEQGGGESSFVLKASDSNQVAVEWSFTSTHENIFERLIGFFALDGMLGPELESGLISLKQIAEKRR